MHEKPMFVGSAKQLFIDDLFFSEITNVKLRVNKPKVTGEKCIVAEHPWEGHRVGAWNTVFEDNGRYRMWYDAIDNEGNRHLCYAESLDGTHWVKPRLGLVEYRGSRDNNIVFPPMEKAEFEGSVFKDSRPECPSEEKYKLIGRLRAEGFEKGIWVFTSPDGLHWRPLVERPVYRDNDTQDVCFWDDRIGKYVAYVRVWDPWRKVGRVEIEDLASWPREEVVFSYDEMDPPNMDFYNSAAFKYPYAENVYFMFPSAYYHFPEPPQGKYRNDGRLEIHFAASRDGIHWNRYDREPFIPIGPEGSWDSGALYMSVGFIRKGGELWLYYTAYDFTHGAYSVRRDKFKGVITRAVIRLDGFVSVHADYRGGEFTTPPLIFKGGRLVLNVNTGATGEAKIEIQDEDGKPIPGFSLREADKINGNFIEKTVAWNGRSNLEMLEGKPVRLRFYMRNTDVYAFQFK